MDAQLKAKWVEALRSGKYQQGSGALHYDDKFCCLGVLCDISGEGAWRSENETTNISYEINGDREDAVLPVALAKKIGLSGGEQDHCWGLNDKENYSFPEIADYIEKNL